MHDCALNSGRPLAASPFAERARFTAVSYGMLPSWLGLVGSALARTIGDSVSAGGLVAMLGNPFSDRRWRASSPRKWAPLCWSAPRTALVMTAAIRGL